MKNRISSNTFDTREFRILLTRLKDQACSSSNVEHPSDELANLCFAELEDDDLYADNSNTASPIHQSDGVQLSDETFLLKSEKDSDMDEVDTDFTAANATVKAEDLSSKVTRADKIRRVSREAVTRTPCKNLMHLVSDAKSNGSVLPKKKSGSSSQYLTRSKANNCNTAIAGKNYHACSHYCNVTFTSRTQLNIHTAETSSSYPVNNRSFASDVLRTTAAKHNAQELWCSICNQSFQSKTFFYYHNLVHEREKQLSMCSAVPESCKTRVNVEHAPIHKQKLFTCSVCDKSFATKSELDKHSSTHYFKLFTCSECGKLFKTKNDYEEHCRIHDEETNFFKLFTCSDCGKLFKTKNDYETHCRVHNEKSIRCHVCKKLFGSANELEIHSGTCCQSLPTSSICGESLKLRNDSEEPTTVCDEEHVWCSVCSESFTMANELEKHSNAHSQEQFTCSNSDTRFTINNNVENPCSSICQKPVESPAGINDFTKPSDVHSKESVPCIDNVESFVEINNVEHCGTQNQGFVSCADNSELLAKMDNLEGHSVVFTQNLLTNSDSDVLRAAKKIPEASKESTSQERVTCLDGGVKNDVPEEPTICNQPLLIALAGNEPSTSVNDLDHSTIYEELITCSAACSDWVPLETTLEDRLPIPELYTCCTCCKTCVSEAQLITHMLNHCSKFPYICVICNCAFTMKHSYEEHIQLHTEKKSCKLCDQSVVLKTDHDYHKPLLCSVCSHPKKDLKGHFVIQYSQFPCYACNEVFPSKKLCSKHYSKMHTRKRFKCSQCRKSFVRKEFFEKHRVTHSEGPLYFTCSVCWRSFSAAYKLEKHFNIHKKKLMSCSICGKQFGMQFALRDHEMSHTTNEKPITTTIRGKSHARKRNIDKYQAFCSNGEWRCYN